MPIVSSVNTERGWLTATADGVITCSEILAHLDEENRSENLALPELIDAVGATLILSSGEVREVVTRLRTLGHNSKLGPTAVVVRSDFAYRMMRMLEITVEDGCSVRPFRRLDEAQRWLEADQASTAQ